MNKWLLLSLLVTHIIGDYYAQSDTLCQQKEIHKGKSLFLYIHALIIGILSWAVVWQTGFIVYAAVIALLHGLVDWIKSHLRQNLSVFLADQLLHLAVLVAVSGLYAIPEKLPIQMLGSFHDISIPLFLVGLMLCGKPTNILIKFILKKYRIGIGEACEDMKNAGALIGNLERILTVLFVLIGQYEAIGFIIAAKSLLRFKETDTAKTEYVLAGTFLSFGIAIIIGLTVKGMSAFF